MGCHRLEVSISSSKVRRGVGLLGRPVYRDTTVVILSSIKALQQVSLSLEAESSTTSHQSSDTLADIQEKIKSLSNEEPDLETSLTLVAETTDNNITPGTRQTRRQLNHHPSTTSETTSNNLTPGTRQTRRQKLNHHLRQLLRTDNNLTPGTRQTKTKTEPPPLTTSGTDNPNSWSQTNQNKKLNHPLTTSENCKPN
ncbi:hypothetical protein J6590_082151 [Homalodisca vitripennis]|nr:hypothetical protein J6590_082151 [Homalodisca vitripennis]